jgi:hypothetical protein
VGGLFWGVGAMVAAGARLAWRLGPAPQYRHETPAQ